MLLHLNESKEERDELFYKAFGSVCNIVPGNCTKLVFEDPNVKRIGFTSKTNRFFRSTQNSKYIFYRKIKIVQFTLNTLVETNYII